MQCAPNGNIELFTFKIIWKKSSKILGQFPNNNFHNTNEQFDFHKIQCTIINIIVNQLM